MNSEQRDVAQFHLKHGFPLDQDVKELQEHDSCLRLDELAADLAQMAEDSLALAIHADKHHQDTRMWNAHLLIEEISELCTGLARSDEEQIADALGDILYVALGVAVRYGLPAKAIFDEVHRSNMTKEYRAENNGRLRNKGDNYSPPNMRKILEARLRDTL